MRLAPSGDVQMSPGWARLAIRVQRIDDLPLSGECALGQPGHPWGHRRLQASHHAQAGKDIIGPNGGCDLPYDKLNYRTWCAVRPAR